MFYTLALLLSCLAKLAKAGLHIGGDGGKIIFGIGSSTSMAGTCTLEYVPPASGGSNPSLKSNCPISQPAAPSQVGDLEGIPDGVTLPAEINSCGLRINGPFDFSNSKKWRIEWKNQRLGTQSTFMHFGASHKKEDGTLGWGTHYQVNNDANWKHQVYSFFDDGPDYTGGYNVISTDISQDDDVHEYAFDWDDERGSVQVIMDGEVRGEKLKDEMHGFGPRLQHSAAAEPVVEAITFGCVEGNSYTMTKAIWHSARVIVY
jgi:hypothetical protein